MHEMSDSYSIYVGKDKNVTKRHEILLFAIILPYILTTKKIKKYILPGNLQTIKLIEY